MTSSNADIPDLNGATNPGVSNTNLKSIKKRTLELQMLRESERHGEASADASDESEQETLAEEEEEGEVVTTSKAGRVSHKPNRPGMVDTEKVNLGVRSLPHVLNLKPRRPANRK